MTPVTNGRPRGRARLLTGFLGEMRRARRSAVKQLNPLDDHLLDDIRVIRGAIADAVRDEFR